MTATGSGLYETATRTFCSGFRIMTPRRWAGDSARVGGAIQPPRASQPAYASLSKSRFSARAKYLCVGQQDADFGSDESAHFNNLN
jgi:hypothetical protein